MLEFEIDQKIIHCHFFHIDVHKSIRDWIKIIGSVSFMLGLIQK